MKSPIKEIANRIVADRYDQMTPSIAKANKAAQDSLKDFEKEGIKVKLEDKANFDTDASVVTTDPMYKGVGVSFHVPRGISLTQMTGKGKNLAIQIITVKSVYEAIGVILTFPKTNNLEKAFTFVTGRKPTMD